MYTFLISEKRVDNDFSVAKGYACNNEIETVESIGYINHIPQKIIRGFYIIFFIFTIFRSTYLKGQGDHIWLNVYNIPALKINEAIEKTKIQSPEPLCKSYF